MMTNEQAAKTLTRMVGLLLHEGYNSSEFTEAVTLAVGYLMIDPVLERRPTDEET